MEDSDSFIMQWWKECLRQAGQFDSVHHVRSRLAKTMVHSHDRLHDVVRLTRMLRMLPLYCRLFLDHPLRCHRQNSLQNYLWSSSVKSSSSFHSQISKRSLWHLGSHEVWPYPSYLDIYDIRAIYHSNYLTFIRRERM